ncbi:LPXTG cell wall anchor domain-containing protein [Streptomyces gobitricini]|uniref:Gram-positive cocci surface proteins LPxTG domain-containing protein n=1 Tax=Streptomyces gobitricini TaxID=68211 RepID=A0ABP5ZV21_9ACTN
MFCRRPGERLGRQGGTQDAINTTAAAAGAALILAAGAAYGLRRRTARQD